MIHFLDIDRQNLIWKLNNSFEYHRFNCNIEELKDISNRNEVKNFVECELRKISEDLKFLLIHKHSDLSWILDWSNKYEKFKYIKVYIGPHMEDHNKIEVKTMFLDDCPDNIIFR